MQTRTILLAVGKAYKDFASAFTPQKNTDELFSVFTSSLDKSLGEYEIVYDYIWGKDTLGIDGATKNYIPKEGDTLIMDISVGVDGVWCDVCRTFFVQQVSDEQEKAYQMILSSVRAGQRALKPEALACDIYSAVNAVYLKNGKELVHHAGHKIGEKPLMQPQFLSENQSPIELGQTYTVESGLYQKFGIRLENDYIIEQNGARDLFEDILPLDNIKEYILK